MRIKETGRLRSNNGAMNTVALFSPSRTPF
jgi:hypothetical protein